MVNSRNGSSIRGGGQSRGHDYCKLVAPVCSGLSAIKHEKSRSNSFVGPHECRRVLILFLTHGCSRHFIGDFETWATTDTRCVMPSGRRSAHLRALLALRLEEYPLFRLRFHFTTR